MSPETDNVDPGEPISELLELESETRSDFDARIRRRINRRELASQSVDLSFVSFIEVFKSYVSLLFLAIIGPRRKGED